MTLYEYQEKAMSTKMDTCDNVPYMMFNIMSEIGEAAGKIAKMIRKGQVRFGSVVEKDGTIKHNVMMTDPDNQILPEQWLDLQKECGDVLWQWAGLCDVLGFDVEHTAEQNLEKLASRKERGVIDGNGDNR